MGPFWVGRQKVYVAKVDVLSLSPLVQAGLHSLKNGPLVVEFEINGGQDRTLKQHQI